MPLARPLFPWPMLLGSVALGGALIPRLSSSSSLAESLLIAWPASCLLVLCLLVQWRARSLAGSRWAADTSACVLVLGSPLLAEALAGSPTPTASLMLFGGVLLCPRPHGQGHLRLVGASILWSGASIIAPHVLPATLCLLLWSILVPSSPGGRLLGGSAGSAMERLAAMAPGALLWPIFVLLSREDASLPGPVDLVRSALLSLEYDFWILIPPLLFGLAGVLLAVFKRRLHSGAAPLALVAIVQTAAAATLALGHGNVDADAAGGHPFQVFGSAASPALPFVLVFASVSLSWLRNRSGARGPLWAGIAGGLISSTIAVSFFHIVTSAEELRFAIAAVAAAATACLVMALLFPGSASGGGRAKSLLLFSLSIVLSSGAVILVGSV